MVTVTIPKKEYERLTEKALRYEYFRQILEEDIFVSPPIKDPREVIREFKKSGLYNRKFLGSLEKGLKRSFHFREK